MENTDQPTENEKISIEQPTSSQLGKVCSFNKELDRYVCTDATSHQLEAACNPDDPNCLLNGIHDPKQAKNDSRNKCHKPMNAFCTGKKRDDFKAVERVPNPGRSSCRNGDVLCFLANWRSIRTFRRSKRISIGSNCNDSDDDSNCKMLNGSTSNKVIIFVMRPDKGS